MGWLSGVEHRGTDRDEDALCTTRNIASLQAPAGLSGQASGSAPDAPSMGTASGGLQAHFSC